jgi:hypothetical protein
MRASLIKRLRLCGRAVVAMAAAVMLVQAFLAGLAGGQVVLVLSADSEGIAVICHSGGGAPADPGRVPGAPERQHPCCESCTAGVPPAVLPAPSLAPFAAQDRPAGPLALRAVSILIAPRAVRAGASQAPPASL